MGNVISLQEYREVRTARSRTTTIQHILEMVRGIDGNSALINRDAMRRVLRLCKGRADVLRHEILSQVVRCVGYYDLEYAAITAATTHVASVVTAERAYMEMDIEKRARIIITSQEDILRIANTAFLRYTFLKSPPSGHEEAVKDQCVYWSYLCRSFYQLYFLESDDVLGRHMAVYFKPLALSLIALSVTC